ncbi:hypothetical protein ACE6H2_002754 [Prunus campanulata]
MSESKKSVDETILKEMKQRLKQQKEALEESIASLRAESKVAVETQEDDANLCDLVKLKPWKVKVVKDFVVMDTDGLGYGEC